MGTTPQRDPRPMNDKTQPVSSVWRTEHLRLTVFPETEQPLLLVRDWWTMLTESPPARVIEEPQGGSVQVLGIYKDAPLAMKAETGRLDITRPFASGQQTPDALPTFAEALEPFKDLAARSLGNPASPSVQRLAFGTTILQILPGIEACRSAMDGYLPAVDMQLAEPTGFLYQANRRCAARAVDCLSLNRIMKWSIQQIQAAGVPLHIIQLDLDLNSQADRAAGLEYPVELFAELADHAVRFAGEGDQR